MLCHYFLSLLARLRSVQLVIDAGMHAKVRCNSVTEKLGLHGAWLLFFSFCTWLRCSARWSRVGRACRTFLVRRFCRIAQTCLAHLSDPAGLTHLSGQSWFSVCGVFPALHALAHAATAPSPYATAPRIVPWALVLQLPVLFRLWLAVL